MNNEALITRLKIAERYYVGEVSPLFREAASEIERLERELKNRIKEIKDLEGLLVNRIEENKDLKDRLAARNNELRDHIAIAAMEGCLSAKGWHPEYIIPAGGGHVGGQRAADAAAESAYKYADAMLKAGEKR